MRVCLASGSPRRLELLRQAGIEPEVRIPDVPEMVRTGETPGEMVLRLAVDKAEAVLAAGVGGVGLVIAADTVISLEGRVLGKPVDNGAAMAMLAMLSGRSHSVLTGMALFSPPAGRWSRTITETIVSFRNLDSSLLREYVTQDKVTDCAGAYRIQGRGFCLLDADCGITGSYSNVVGLPLERLFVEAAALGIDLLNL